MEQKMNDSENLIREIGSPIYEGRGWIKFLGVISIAGGIIYALSIIGIVIAWLPIWMGVILYQSATKMEQAYAAGDKRGFHESMDKLKLYFMIQGILTLIGIVFAIIALSVGMLGVVLDAIR